MHTARFFYSKKLGLKLSLKAVRLEFIGQPVELNEHRWISRVKD